MKTVFFISILILLFTGPTMDCHGQSISTDWLSQSIQIDTIHLKDSTIKDGKFSDSSYIHYKYFLMRKNKYLSIGVGWGIQYAGFLGLRFQQRFGNVVGFGYHLGIGLSGWRLEDYGGSAGLKFFLYKGLFIDCSAAYMRFTKTTYVNNIKVSEEKYWDVVTGMMVGYDWLFGKNFGFNLDGGWLIAMSDIQRPIIRSMIPFFDIGFIVKITK